jgi:hypothetical protein
MQLNALLHPLKLTAAIALASILGTLTACTGNSSSTSPGPIIVIDPIEIDKTLGVVDWDQNNEVEMASHAYRAVARHSMLATLYSGRSAIFSSFINLVNGSSARNCYVSGSIDADLLEKQCQNSSDDDVSCTVTNTDNGEEESNPLAVLQTTEQRAVFYQCQDGLTEGLYFDGPLRVIVADDFSVDDTFTATTTISAVAEVSKQDENGDFILDANDEVEKVNATDFLYQSESYAFFIGYEYNLDVIYDTSSDRLSSPSDLSECTTADETVNGVFTQGTSIVAQEVMRTDFVAALQESYPLPSSGPQFPYAEFTDLDLVASNDNFRCEDLNDDTDVINESLSYDTTYTLSTKIASKILGQNTQFDWNNLVIPTDQENIEGAITLTHTNTDANDYLVSVVFDGLGGVTVNSGSSMTVQEFLSQSELEVE